MVYKSGFSVLFLFFASVAWCQNRWMLPVVKSGQQVKACSIYKTTAHSNSKEDSIRELFATVQYNNAGQITALYVFRSDSAVDFEEYHSYNAQGFETMRAERERPDTTYYNFVPTEPLAKHMYDEFYAHHWRKKIVSRYDAANHLIRQISYVASFNQPLTEKNISLSERYAYDAAGRLIRKEILDDDDSTVVYMTDFYAYDTHGNMIRKKQESKEDTSVNEYTYNAANKLTEIRFGVKPGKPCYTERYTYDVQNNCLSKIKRDDKDSAYSFDYYTYKDTVLVGQSFHNDRGDYNSEDLYTYDQEHHLLREQNNQMDGSPYYNDVTHYDVKIRKYDADSNIVSEERYYHKKRKGDYAGRSEYTYNKAKQVIREKMYYSNGQFRSLDVYEYNTLNQRAKVMRFDKDSVLKETEINFYDQQGWRKARELYEPSGKLMLYQTYRHNSRGEEVGGIFFHGGMQTTVKEYSYDAKGLLKEIKVKTPEGQYYRYTYRYTYN
ncbi:MAG: hypothetical protein JST26_09580 [Bacteroidetes bacterium]|nr:hypothetical protein [Bacteroidota bacterium]